MGSDQLSLFAAGPVEVTKAGIYLTEADMWLDACSSQRLSFVSHAHTDHISSHERALLTAPTRQFLDIRLGAHKTEIVELEYNQPYQLGRCVATLFPAGHILGSAQVMVEGSQRIVYTGDFRLRPNPVVETTEVKRCDLLIMEATFGTPEFRFPSDTEIARALKLEIDGARSRKQMPIIRAYALGKAQEVVALLNGLGYRVAADPETLRYCNVYESFGVKLGPVSDLWEDFPNPDTDVYVVGTRAVFRELREQLPAVYSIFASGWGVDPKARFRYGVDVVIPLSDHADFYDLLEYVRKAQPREILVTHGPACFAASLRELGFNARHIG